MKIKTSELTGAALDWAVAKCEGLETWQDSSQILLVGDDEPYHPSTDWSQGGLIIENEGIGINAHMEKEEWIANDYWNQIQVSGETPLIAAMRCYVASKLGDEVEIPDELMEAK